MRGLRGSWSSRRCTTSSPSGICGSSLCSPSRVLPSASTRPPTPTLSKYPSRRYAPVPPQHAVVPLHHPPQKDAKESGLHLLLHQPHCSPVPCSQSSLSLSPTHAHTASPPPGPLLIKPQPNLFNYMQVHYNLYALCPYESVHIADTLCLLPFAHSTLSRMRSMRSLTRSPTPRALQ